jgi:hypothetical protein
MAAKDNVLILLCKCKCVNNMHELIVISYYRHMHDINSYFIFCELGFGPFGDHKIIYMQRI